MRFTPWVGIIGHDERFLRVLAGTSIEYIGLLGPSRGASDC
jgi:hypothetical protein